MPSVQETAETLQAEAQCRPLSQAEVAVVLGISDVRVEQIERLALKKLRVGLGRLGVTAEDIRGIADTRSVKCGVHLPKEVTGKLCDE